jgi:glycosyltransferase involved in cell wall biosynthesis
VQTTSAEAHDVTDRITVSMPMWHATNTIRRSVESVLNQTHHDLTLIVVNDGGPPDVWTPLEDIGDPRLIRFDLTPNRGRYQADAITLAACQTAWWTVQDADDWTEPERLQRLLTKAKAKQADAVFGGYRQHRLDGTERVVTPHRIAHMAKSRQLRHVAHHTALYRTEAIRSIGGPHPEYRIAWDTFMIAVVAHKLSWAYDMEALYHHCHQPTSLMQSPATMKGSPERVRTQERLRQEFAIFLRRGTLPKVKPRVQRQVDLDAARLREMLP